jgi:hypothetical protein
VIFDDFVRTTNQERMTLFFLLLFVVALVCGQNVSSLDIEAMKSIARGKSFKKKKKKKNPPMKFKNIFFSRPTFSDALRHKQSMHNFRRKNSSTR